MKTLMLALVALLSGCQSPTWGGTADALLPDEFTMGAGSGTHTGDLATHSPEWPYEGESESTYAALTWDLPSFTGGEGGLSRDTRRNLSLLIDQMVEEEIEAETDSSPVLEFKMPTMKGRKPPSAVLWGLAAFLVAIVAVVVGKSRRKDPWS